MADEIEDLGPVPRALTNNGQQASRSGAAPPSKPSHQPSLDRRDGASTASTSGVVQPKPQALPKRSGPAAIIVSPRQKGNPMLNNMKSMPWEYGDIPADYVLGLTNCALFLSLKYHRLHPEYIYTRIKGLQGKYALRIVLCLVDIDNHEDSLKELSKTSVINNVTIVLCWSAVEGARYLELFKTYENAAPTSIKQHQSNAYSDRMIEFITTPRSINKTDAVSLVSTFGTIRTAVNGRHEDVATIAGWGEKKVQQWCSSVREPFRNQRAAKRGAVDADLLVGSQPVSRAPTLSRDVTQAEVGPSAAGLHESTRMSSGRPGTAIADADRRPSSHLAEQVPANSLFVQDEEGTAEMTVANPAATRASKGAAEAAPPTKRKSNDDPLTDGVMAALSKLRKS